MASIFAAAVIALAAAPAPQISVIPKPESVQSAQGSFRLTARTGIHADNSLGALARYLEDRLRPATGYAFPIVARAGSGVIDIGIDRRATGLGDEGYTLEVKSNKILIRANKEAGLFYGCQTLLQLLPPDIFRKATVGREWSVPAVKIVDKPRFSWRGAHMDVSRHFMPREAVLKYLDLMALHKLNVFHIHLTDDNGWRFEVKRYPRLTEVGSLTDFSAMNPAGATRSINQRPGGFYTQDDIREIVRYAADLHITVVPEIEMPGHSNAAILAYPELGNRVQIAEAGGDTKFLGTYDNVYNGEDNTIEFLKSVLDEVMELFPSKFIHIGGDEVWKEPWKQNPKVRAKMKTLGLKNEEEFQSWFIKQFDSYLASKGRRLIGWDEILEGGLAPGAAVMSWRGIEGGIAAAKAGHDVVMSPTSHAYFDYYQSRVSLTEPKGIGGYVPIEKVYSFDPVPPALKANEAKRVLGGQANLWAEFIPHPKHLEYMAYPRLCAMAEVLWSPNAGRSFDEFSQRLATHLVRLDRLDVNYRPLTADPRPAAKWKAGDTTEAFQPKEWDVTRAIPSPGEFDVLFSFTGGDHRLDIDWVEILENGEVLQRVEHRGQAGSVNRDNSYRIKLPSIRRDAKYTLRASIRSDGGNNSNGDIYFIRRS